MEVRQDLVAEPFFSVCVPQYNRTSFFMAACRTLAAQTFGSFELCISDDLSTDGREEELIALLKELGLSFVYRKRERNGRYDANLRSAIALSRGAHCFLLGNDDALATPETLRRMHDAIQAAGGAGVLISNFADFTSGKVVRRMTRSGRLGSGPAVAASIYRNFSFVSGVVLDGPRARALATERWDGSAMYQMYIGCRIIAEGGQLVGLDEVAIRKDIQIPGEEVDSYAKRPRQPWWPIKEHRHNFDQIGRLVVDAIEPHLSGRERQRLVENVLAQLLVFTYPFWLFEYRRIQSWSYALGVCLGMRPRYTFAGVELSRPSALRLYLLFGLVSVLGLLVPVRWFDALYPRLWAIAKSVSA